MKGFMKGASGLATVIAAGALVAGCEGSSSYRVASVGDQSAAAQTGDPEAMEPMDGNGSGTGSNGSGSGSGSGSGTGGSQTGQSDALGKVLITAGNVVLGVAQKQDAVTGKVNGLAPVTAPVTGKVTRLLTATGQSLVDIGNGRTVLVGGANNAIGRVVSLGIANRSLVGVSSGQSLVGVNLLTRTPVTGSLVTAGALAGNSLAVVDVTKPSSAGALNVLSPTGGASGLTGAVGSTLSNVGSALPTGITGGLTGAASGSASTPGAGLLPGVNAAVGGTVRKVVRIGGPN